MGEITSKLLILSKEIHKFHKP